MLSLLFLDVDGVLTTTRSPYEMVPACVTRLDHLLSVTGAEVVVSSSWRLAGLGPKSDFQVVLRRICKEMDGTTVRFDRILRRLHGATISLPRRLREDEILEYVARARPDRFAAVDDFAPDFSHPPPDWLVLTDPSQGLDAATEQRLLALLRALS